MSTIFRNLVGHFSLTSSHILFPQPTQNLRPEYAQKNCTTEMQGYIMFEKKQKKNESAGFYNNSNTVHSTALSNSGVG